MSAVSPLVSLATSMHAQPGVYAVLLGSGVSTGAGIPTGWGVVRELIGRVAAASTPGDENAARAAWDDPEGWWASRDHGELGYASLLEALASTQAARQGLLAGFFEPDAEERAEGLKQPTKAHQAIAELVKRGYVRVVVTTNFDRLMEQALEAAGVSPQVIARPEAVNGMAPLAHSPATLLKLHGDYKDLGSLNTPAELSAYAPEWNELLSQVFDEYGLVISGWSADWDGALVGALEAAPARRYPLFWDARSSKGENAQRLLQSRVGTRIPATSADALFSELIDSVDALESLASPPLTTAMAVARLKRYLPDPVRRIDLHDLVMRATDDVVAAIAAQPVTAPQVTLELLQDVYTGHFRSMELLGELLITGVWHDPEGHHDALWVDVLQRLIDAGTVSLQSSNDALGMARLLPALIALSVVGVTATLRDRDSVFIRLATEPEAITPYEGRDPLVAAQVLHVARLVQDDWINQLPRWAGGSGWLFPASHLMVTDLWPFFSGHVASNADFVRAYRSFEYRLGLIQQHTPGYSAISGEFVNDREWDDDLPTVEVALRRQIGRGRSAAWRDFFGGPEELEAALVAHRAVLRSYRRYR